ncbi:mammalian ependymin-related protein 1 [Monodelphis domestica]|uniref:mammalian ependymin-related protein 1 n=1 Tax=Monodelphis domestica TaxID=13616 RepID=UPI0024E20B16|nr:mammalian ependymin-related protein 1 [Monodelphis domestica]
MSRGYQDAPWFWGAGGVGGRLSGSSWQPLLPPAFTAAAPPARVCSPPAFARALPPPPARTSTLRMPIGLWRARLPLHFLLAAESRRGGIGGGKGSRSRSRSRSGREPAASSLPAVSSSQLPVLGEAGAEVAAPSRRDWTSVPPSPGKGTEGLGEGGDGGESPCPALPTLATSPCAAHLPCAAHPALPCPWPLCSPAGSSPPALSAAAPRGMRAALLVALLLGGFCSWELAVGEPGPPCQAPQQWEGRQVRYEHSSGRSTRALLTYDGPQQRIRLLEERKALIPCKKFFEYIFLYQDGVMFQIDQATQLCSKIALTDQWDPLDIPQNSTFEDQYYIGGPQDQIMIQEWSDRKAARKYETWIGVYTVKDCYPVQETYIRNYSVTFSTRFFDIQLGIRDPSVFTPPSTCERAQTRMMSEAC